MCGFERWVGLSRTAGNDGGKISFASVTNLGPQVLTHRSRDPNTPLQVLRPVEFAVGGGCRPSAEIELIS